MKRNLLFLFVFLTSGTLFSQPSAVKPEDALLAKKLKEKYKGKDLVTVSLRSKDEISFSLATSKQLKAPVLAYQNASHNLIALKDNSSFNDALYYDNQSEILELKGKGLRGKPVYISSMNKTYEQDGIFCSDAKMCVFSFPFETRGEKIDLTYEKRYYDLKYLTSVFFHDWFPIEEKTISFSVPDWLTVELKEMNFDGYEIVKNVIDDPKKNAKTYSFTAKNLKAMKNEEDAPNPAFSYPHILVLCKSYKAKDGTENKLFESVKDLYAWYSSLVKEVKNDNALLKPVVERITASKQTDLEKIEAIFYWVQDNIRYIAFERGIMGFKPEAAQSVFKNKYGDCKGMANLTKEMLKTAGYDARLTWIGTRDIPYDYSIASLGVDNHMICTVILNGKRYFLDGTEDYIALNDYAHRIQGRQVLIEDGDNYILDNIPEFTADRNKEDIFATMSVEGDILRGHYKSIVNGEEKINVQYGLASIRSDDKKDALKKYLSKNSSNIRLENVSTSNLEERQKPLEMNYDFELQNHVTAISDKEIYVLLDKDKEYGDSEIDTSERVNDYEMSHKIYVSSKTEFTVPAGYKVEYMPDPVEKKYPDFTFSLKYELNKNKIVYTKKITIDNAIIRKKNFNDWNLCVKELRKFYKDPIQLSKTK